MDAPDLPPLPPLPLGDAAGPPADADALRGILRRHRHRQLASGALAFAVILGAGGAAGFAVGHTTAPAAHGVQVAADTPAAADGAASTAGTAPEAPPGLSAASGVSAVSAGGSTAISALAYPGPAFTQVLVRNASDGTRVRLYEQQFPAKPPCPTGASCPEIAMPACVPSSFVTAEVSDDQVAGQTSSPVWSAKPTGVMDVFDLGVVGAGQPQPILVVVARVQPAVAKVTLTTPYGSDDEAPTAGWAALAVRLPAGFTKAGTDGIGASTLVATDSSDKTLLSEPLSTARAAPPECRPCAGVGAGTASTGQVTGGAGAAASAGAGGSENGGAGAATAPSRPPMVLTPGPVPCTSPCPPVGSSVKGALPNMAMCTPPPRDTTTTSAAPTSPTSP